MPVYSDSRGAVSAAGLTVQRLGVGTAAYGNESFPQGELPLA